MIVIKRIWLFEKLVFKMGVVGGEGLIGIEGWSDAFSCFRIDWYRLKVDRKLLSCGCCGPKFIGPGFSLADVSGLLLGVSGTDVFVGGFWGEWSLFLRDVDAMHFPDSWTAGMRTWYDFSVQIMVERRRQCAGFTNDIFMSRRRYCCSVMDAMNLYLPSCS